MSEALKAILEIIKSADPGETVVPDAGPTAEGASAQHLDAGDEAQGADVAEALVLLTEKVRGAIADASEAGSEAIAAAVDLSEALQESKEEVVQACEEFVAVQLASLETIGEELGEVQEYIGTAVIEELQGHWSALGAELENRLSAEFTQFIDETGEPIREGLVDLSDVGQRVAEECCLALNSHIEDIGENLKRDVVEATQGRVEEFGRNIVRETGLNLAKDLGLVQLSTALATSLSSQMPQLIAAKHAVGAVRKGLELLRAGR
jgi:hypothetical protein